MIDPHRTQLKGTVMITIVRSMRRLQDLLRESTFENTPNKNGKGSAVVINA